MMYGLTVRPGDWNVFEGVHFRVAADPLFGPPTYYVTVGRENGHVVFRLPPRTPEGRTQTNGGIDVTTIPPATHDADGKPL